MAEQQHCSFCGSATANTANPAHIDGWEGIACNLCWNSVPFSRFTRGSGDLTNTEVVQIVARMLNSIYKEITDA